MTLSSSTSRPQSRQRLHKRSTWGARKSKTLSSKEDYILHKPIAITHSSPHKCDGTCHPDPKTSLITISAQAVPAAQTTSAAVQHRAFMVLNINIRTHTHTACPTERKRTDKQTTDSKDMCTVPGHPICSLVLCPRTNFPR